MRSLAGMQATGQAACLESKAKGGGLQPGPEQSKIAQDPLGPAPRFARRFSFCEVPKRFTLSAAL